MEKKKRKMRSSIEKKFLDKWIPEPNSGCWIWIASTDRNGYGRLKIPGITTYAHRISWLLDSGNLQKEMDVLHKCDNPSCVNPQHLFIGTHQDNMRDRESKGRGKTPEIYWNKKISDEQIKEMFELKGKIKNVEIAKIFNVHRTYVGHLFHGRLRNKNGMNK